MTDVRGQREGELLMRDDARPLLPGSLRLLRGVRTTLAGIARTEQLSVSAAAQLRVADTMLAELSQREDSSFFQSAYARGMALLNEQANGRASASGARNALPETLADTAAFTHVASLLGRLLERLSRAAAERVHRDDGFVRRVIAWETELYAHRRSAEAVTPPPVGAVIEAKPLGRYLADRGMRLAHFERRVGGFQKDTLMLSVEADGAERDIVLRAEKPDRFVKLDASAVVDEFPIVQAIYRAGIPSAEPLWLEADESALGTRFIASARVRGNTPGSAVAAEAISDGALKSLAETLADIHRLPLSRFDACASIQYWRALPSLAENTRLAVEQWDRQIWADRITASPTVAAIRAWLLAHVPKDEEPPVLLHTDYGQHNMLIEDDRITAVLDWEGARIGDRAEDLSYLLLCLGDRADRAQMIEWYERRHGAPIPAERLRYFDVYNSTKLMLGSLYANGLYEHDPAAAVAWCELGLFTMAHGLVAADRALAACRTDEQSPAPFSHALTGEK